MNDTLPITANWINSLIDFAKGSVYQSYDSFCLTLHTGWENSRTCGSWARGVLLVLMAWDSPRTPCEAPETRPRGCAGSPWFVGDAKRELAILPGDADSGKWHTEGRRASLKWPVPLPTSGRHLGTLPNGDSRIPRHRVFESQAVWPWLTPWRGEVKMNRVHLGVTYRQITHGPKHRTFSSCCRRKHFWMQRVTLIFF